MSSKILLITHEGIAGAMVNTARDILDHDLQDVFMIEVIMDADLEKLIADTTAMLERELDGSDLLIMTDLIGSSPYNVAIGIRDNIPGSALITGLNLPMLMKSINSSDLSIAALLDVVIERGRGCISGAHDAEE